MSTFIIQVSTSGASVLFFTGRPGHDWLAEDPAQASEYSPAHVTRRVSELQASHGSAGISFVAVEKPRDTYYALLDNCGDEVGGRGVKGGTGLPGHLRRQYADDLANKHGFRQGEGFIQVHDVASWEVVEKMELAP